MLGIVQMVGSIRGVLGYLYLFIFFFSVPFGRMEDSVWLQCFYFLSGFMVSRYIRWHMSCSIRLRRASRPVQSLEHRIRTTARDKTQPTRLFIYFCVCICAVVYFDVHSNITLQCITEKKLSLWSRCNGFDFWPRRHLFVAKYFADIISNVDNWWLGQVM